MKKIQIGLCIFLLLVFGMSQCWAAGTGTKISADEAQKLLQEGNARHASCSLQHPNMDQACRLRNATEGQKPFATILSCSDSRVPLELLFDRGIGDLFVVRVAGNISDVSQTASIEYGVDHLGTPLLVVLGHTRCGAVTAAVQETDDHGNIPHLVEYIAPAVEAARKKSPDAQEKALVEEAIRLNVWQSIQDLFDTSEVIRASAREGKVKVIGALYDLESGKVEWMGPHPEQDKLIKP